MKIAHAIRVATLLVFGLASVFDYAMIMCGIIVNPFKEDGAVHYLHNSAADGNRALRIADTLHKHKSGSSIPIPPNGNALTQRMLDYAARAYCADSRLGVHPFSFRDVGSGAAKRAIVVNSDFNSAIVIADRSLGRVVVAFRGSVNSANWMHNFRFKYHSPWPANPGAQVHRGFWDSYASLRSEVSAAVRTLSRVACKPRCGRRRPPRIIVTGHSLGGAIAVLFAADWTMKSNGRRSELVVMTFGAPRVGSGEFAAIYEGMRIPTLRIVNAYDLIAFLPLPEMGQRDPFSHVGTLHIFDRLFSKPSIPCTWNAHETEGSCAELYHFLNATDRFHAGQESSYDVMYHVRYMNRSIGRSYCQ